LEYILGTLPYKIAPALFFAVLLSVLPERLAARDIKIFVTDGDLEEPLAGAVIRLPDGSEITAGESGGADFSVPDGTRGAITVTYPGYETVRVMLREGGEDRISVVMRAGLLENEELVVEGRRPAAETALSGRGVSLDSRKMELSSEIGLIEDVMSSIKLLPGVGYSGLFNALPSIRGGEPGDLKAALDGFYIDTPYHWGGGYSIFDPKTIESARLYHGVFSARYSHTVSGLLELTAKRAPSDHAGIGINVSTSAAGFNLSYPLPDFSDFNRPKRGGVMLIGKITYWEPFVAVAKEASRFADILSPINSISTAPYIRSLNLMANYRLSAAAELNLSAYIGGDGVGVLHNNTGGGANLFSDSVIRFKWDNTISFMTANALFAPNSDTMIKTTVGASYISRFMDSYLGYDVQEGDVSAESETMEKYDDRIAGAQLRAEFDRDLKNGFLFSAGAEELYRYWSETLETNSIEDVYSADYEEYRTYSRVYPETKNTGLFTGLYSLLEYNDPAGRFAAETGLRFDHLYFIGDGYTAQTFPALNPRINFDCFPVRDRGGVDLITLTAGSGLFSAIDDSVPYIDKSYVTGDFDLKQTRSSTTVIGVKIDFFGQWSFNLELYYKYIFDRAYTVSVISGSSAVRRYLFDGEGHIWGFDIMLHKMDGRFIDGWIAYSFNYARYRDPKSLSAFGRAMFRDRNDNWYFPEFHRFSNLNIVVNFKPSNRFNIYTRFGFAGGIPQAEYGEKYPYTVNPDGGEEIIKYRRFSYYSDTKRSAFSLPLDIKFSWFFFYPGKKTHTEAYLAVENALSLFYRPKAGTIVNPYTGEEEEAGGTPQFELPIPMVSFGFKWMY
jgi:hypothetical protein